MLNKLFVRHTAKQLSLVHLNIIIVAVMTMNNLSHTLVDCYDVGSFHAPIFKYTRYLGLQLHVWYNQLQYLPGFDYKAALVSKNGL